MNVLAVCVFVSAFVQGAGGGKDVRPIDPALVAKHEKAGKLIDQGRELVGKKRYDEAVVAFRAAIEVENTYGYRVSMGHHELAKALTEAGRGREALAAYRRTFWWNAKKKELEWNGPPVAPMAFDYAILLARQDKPEEAKAMYYFGLRHYNPHFEKAFEPIPFTIVFAPDPKMISWEYTPSRFISVATMAKVPFSGSRDVALAEEVKAREPLWAYPYAYLSTRLANGRELGELAAKYARGMEQVWVTDFRAGRLDPRLGEELRRESVVLAGAKKELATTWGMMVD